MSDKNVFEICQFFLEMTYVLNIYFFRISLYSFEEEEETQHAIASKFKCQRGVREVELDVRAFMKQICNSSTTKKFR